MIDSSVAVTELSMRGYCDGSYDIHATKTAILIERINRELGMFTELRLREGVT